MLYCSSQNTAPTHQSWIYAVYPIKYASFVVLCLVSCDYINSLVPGRYECYFGYIIFKSILVIDGWGISCDVALILLSLDFTDDQSTLVEVMAWCRQATSHYLSQCWPRSLSPYGVTRPQWGNIFWWIIFQYHSGLFHWHWGNQDMVRLSITFQKICSCNLGPVSILRPSFQVLWFPLQPRWTIMFFWKNSKG